MPESTITERIAHLNDTIHQLECAYNRPSGAVQLLAVSKRQPAPSIQEAFNAGQRDFGENYLQEAQAKIKLLNHLPLIWHFIGPIQSNKTKHIANDFSWVHSVCRYKIALQLNDARADELPRLNICLQVNLDGEETKSGITPELITDLVIAVSQVPRLQLRGLMVIPKPQETEQQQYLSFLRLTQMLHSLNQQLNLSMDTLSMGMSDDLQAAIRAGSTMVRIGRAIFGERTTN